MQNTRKKVYRGFTLLELAIIILFTGSVGTFVMYKLTTSIAFSRANDVVKHLQNAMTTAYNTSIELDKINQTDAPLKLDGCSVMNRNGSWYLVCNLEEITRGNNREQKFILDIFEDSNTAVGLIAGFEDADSKEKIAMFLRFSSAEQKPHSKANGEFVGVFAPEINFN